jgi:hypothetical protein
MLFIALAYRSPPRGTTRIEYPLISSAISYGAMKKQIIIRPGDPVTDLARKKDAANPGTDVDSGISGLTNFRDNNVDIGGDTCAKELPLKHA